MIKSITASILWGALMVIYSHPAQVAGDKEKILIENNRPTVYITFEREGKREPIYTSESNQGIWLRLHNNTKWAINFCTQGLSLKMD